jgi:hypothetical protein
MIMARTARDVQEQLDPWFRKVGYRAPLPPAGQSPNHYLAEQCRFLKREFLPRNHPYYKVQYRSVRDDSAALNALVPKLLDAVVTEAFNPANYPDEPRKMEVRDEYGTLKFVQFIGQTSFVKGMGRPGRRVKGFYQPVERIRY